MRDDVPAIVERLVAEGERVFGVRLVRSTLEDAYLAPPPSRHGRRVSDVLVVAVHAVRESLRRRVFAVVVVITLAFGGLYAWGASELFEDVSGFSVNEFGIDAKALAGATILGLSMFGTLFLGVVLAVFLTLGAVRGDAERGLLQPLIVRPLGRRQYLAGTPARRRHRVRAVRGGRLHGRGRRHGNDRRLVAGQPRGLRACGSRAPSSSSRRCACSARSSSRRRRTASRR